jgi:hypothetical protein
MCTSQDLQNLTFPRHLARAGSKVAGSLFQPCTSLTVPARCFRDATSHPSGEAYNIVEGILRVHSERADSASVDRAHVVDMVGTANVFLPGHSIRVDVRRTIDVALQRGGG